MNKQQFLTHAGLQVHTLEFWIEQQWLIPDQTSTEMTFSDTDVARAHLINDLKGDFGVNDEGVDVILHLIDQVVLLGECDTSINEIVPLTMI